MGKQSNTNIGVAWYKVSEGGQEYISMSINPELLPLTITEKHSLVMFPINETDKKETSPTHRIVLSLKGGSND